MFMRNNERLVSSSTPSNMRYRSNTQRMLAPLNNGDIIECRSIPAVYWTTTIIIRAKDHTGGETFHRIARSTKMKRLFQHYCTAIGKDYNTLRFLLNGERIPGNATTETLEMDDYTGGNGSIDCMPQQTGD